MSYHERCDTLNNNPALVARHFQYRVEMFFRIIVLDGPLGKTQYYAILVEFQARGGPHINSFIWILNAPKLTKADIGDYRNWFDSVIKSDLPDPNNEPALFELIKLIKYIVIQKIVVNIEMKSVGSALVNFSQTKP